MQSLSFLPFERSRCAGIWIVDKYFPFLALKIQKCFESAARIEILLTFSLHKQLYVVDIKLSQKYFDLQRAACAMFSTKPLIG